MQSNTNYITEPTNPHKCGYTEKEILDRAVKDAPVNGAYIRVHCPNHTAHSHGDKNASATYNQSTGYLSCFVCSERGFALDRDRPDYRKGNIRYQYAPGQTVVRKNGARSKRITQEIAPDKKGTLWPIYGLAALDKFTRIVYVLEGERCVDTLNETTVLHAAGAVGSTNIVCLSSAGGSKSASKTDWKPLAEHLAQHPDCALVYVPDCDAAGAKYVQDVDALLGKPERAQTIDLRPYSQGKTGYDLADYLDAGKPFCALKTQVYARASVAPVGEPEHQSHSYWQAMPATSLEWEFLWRGWLPIGALTLIGGRAGVGKGVTLATIAACALGYRDWPDGEQTARGGRVLWCGIEDDIQRTLVPRFKKAGIKDTSQVLHYRAHPNLPAMHPADALLSQSPPKDLRLIVVDPLISGQAGDSNSAVQARAWCEAWALLAQQWHVPVIGVMHSIKWSKAKVQEGALEDLIAGSGQYVAVARCAWLLLKDDRDPTGARLLHRAKSNFDVPNICTTYRVHAAVKDNAAYVDRFEVDPDGYIAAQGMAEGKEDKRTATQQTILDYLEGEPGQKAKQAEVTAYVEATVDVSDVAARKAISVLLKDCAISRIGEGRPNNPYILQLEFG